MNISPASSSAGSESEDEFGGDDLDYLAAYAELSQCPGTLSAIESLHAASFSIVRRTQRLVDCAKLTHVFARPFDALSECEFYASWFDPYFRWVCSHCWFVFTVGRSAHSCVCRVFLCTWNVLVLSRILG